MYLFPILDDALVPPRAALPTDDHHDTAHDLVRREGDPQSVDAHTEHDREQIGARHADDPVGHHRADRREVDVARAAHTGDDDDIGRPAEFKYRVHEQDGTADRDDVGVIGEEAQQRFAEQYADRAGDDRDQKRCPIGSQPLPIRLIIFLRADQMTDHDLGRLSDRHGEQVEEHRDDLDIGFCDQLVLRQAIQHDGGDHEL